MDELNPYAVPVSKPKGTRLAVFPKNLKRFCQTVGLFCLTISTILFLILILVYASPVLNDDPGGPPEKELIPIAVLSLLNGVLFLAVSLGHEQKAWLRFGWASFTLVCSTIVIGYVT